MKISAALKAKKSSKNQTPRYQLLTQEVRRQVASGVLQPGDCLPSISALRAAYGISKSTIERAHLILEQEGLIVREHGRGTFVKAAPQRSTRKKRSVIGFCNSGFSHRSFSPFWAHLMEGVENAARDMGAQLVLLRDDAPGGWDAVDGVLVNGNWAKIPAHHIAPDLPLVSFFAPAKIIGAQAERERIMSGMTTIYVDLYAGIREATEHLLELGHRRIAYLHNGEKDTTIHPRALAGYRGAMREAGIKPNARWQRALPGPARALYFMPIGRDTIKAWLEDDWNRLNCSALLTFNDEVAWGAVEAFREAGIRVPEDVSVVGFDGTEIADCCNPKLTTLQVPLEAMGEQSVRVLQDRIAGKTVEREMMISTKLRVAGSTARV